MKEAYCRTKGCRQAWCGQEAWHYAEEHHRATGHTVDLSNEDVFQPAPKVWYAEPGMEGVTTTRLEKE